MCYNFKHNDHIKLVTNKLKNLTDILKLKKIRVVYQILIESIVNYGIFIWEGMLKQLHAH